MTPGEDAVAILYTLWNNAKGYGELRLLHPEGALKPLYLKLPLIHSHLVPALEWAFKKNTQGCNVYFGVHPRSEPHGKNEFVPQYFTFVADIDNPDLGWPFVQQLIDNGLPPSICVRTPRGVHLYWLLQEPEPTNTQTRTRLKLLQKAVKSDMVHDPARILRLPGTVCHKNDTGLLNYTAWLRPELRYTSEEIANKVHKLWPDLVVAEEKPDAVIAVVGVAKQNIPQDVWDHYAQPIPKGQRSEICLGFLQTALMYGWSDDQIFTAIQTMPIGGHYLERNDPAGSFRYDLDKKAKPNVQRSIHGALKVYVQDASIFINPPPGFVKLKLRLAEIGSSTSFNEWLTVDPGNLRLKRFLTSVGCTFDQFNDQAKLLDAVIGKTLRVEFSDTLENKVKFFFPNIN
jgi:hypothetical protein